MLKQFTLLTGCLLVAVVAAACASSGRTWDTKDDPERTFTVLETLDAPGSEISALAWSRMDLWCADGGTGAFYRFDKDGHVERMFEPLPEHGTPLGMAWLSGFIWMTSTKSDQVFKYSYKGELLRVFDAPVPRPLGLGWDGTYLWMVEGEQGGLWRLSLVGKRFDTEELIRDPTVPLEGVTWDGTSLWACSPDRNRILRLDPVNGSLLDVFAGPGGRPVRLAWDGEALWVADNATGKIFRVAVPSDD